MQTKLITNLTTDNGSLVVLSSTERSLELATIDAIVAASSPVVALLGLVNGVQGRELESLTCRRSFRPEQAPPAQGVNQGKGSIDRVSSKVAKFR